MIRDENVYTYLIQSNIPVSALTAEPSFSFFKQQHERDFHGGLSLISSLQQIDVLAVNLRII